MFEYNFVAKEGETIEDKCARIVDNNEPITDGAPMIYTKRSEGVKQEYNIRTDKFEVAQEAMERVTEAKKNKIKESIAKSMNAPKDKEEPKTEEPKTES